MTFRCPSPLPTRLTYEAARRRRKTAPNIEQVIERGAASSSGRVWATRSPRVSRPGGDGSSNCARLPVEGHFNTVIVTGWPDATCPMKIKPTSVNLPPACVREYLAASMRSLSNLIAAGTWSRIACPG